MVDRELKITREKYKIQAIKRKNKIKTSSKVDKFQNL